MYKLYSAISFTVLHAEHAARMCAFTRPGEYWRAVMYPVRAAHLRIAPRSPLVSAPVASEKPGVGRRGRARHGMQPAWGRETAQSLVKRMSARPGEDWHPRALCGRYVGEAR